MLSGMRLEVAVVLAVAEGVLLDIIVLCERSKYIHYEKISVIPLISKYFYFSSVHIIINLSICIVIILEPNLYRVATSVLFH